MDLRRIIAAALVLSSAACAAPEGEDDAEGTNDALSTPRDMAEMTPVERLRSALDDAGADDFEKDFASKAKPYIDDVLAYVKASFDPNAQAYSFEMPKALDKDETKYYVVDIRSSATKQKLFYVYRAAYEGRLWSTEIAPMPFARCDDQDKTLKCFAVSNSQRIYEPPAKTTM